MAVVGHQWSGHVGGTVMPLGVSRPSRLEQAGPIAVPANTFQNSWILSIIHEKVALLTLPWVFVLWFAAFCGVVLITAGLIGSSR